MNSRERFIATVERKPVDRPACWLGDPTPEAVPALCEYYHVKDIKELKKECGDDFYAVEIPYKSPTCSAIFAAFDWYMNGSNVDTEHRTLTADGCFAHCEDLEDIEAVNFQWPDPEKYLVALCSVSGAMIMNKGIPMIVAIIASILIVALAGFITGGVTAKLKLHSFLVTLSLMTAFRGLAQTMTNGRPVAGLPSSFGKLASASIGPVPVLVIYMIVLYAIFMYVMKYTAFGRSIYAVGSNQESARLSGINIEMVKTMVFVLSGALCGVAGVLLTAKVRSGDPTCANGWQMAWYFWE